jgi:transcriptional regulator
MNSPFKHFENGDVRALIAAYPLAWIVPQGGGAHAATQLPLLGEFADDGALKALVGHMSRRNPLLEAVSANPRATILFSGPQGYVSPSQAGLKDWGPTWNYAQLALDCTIDVLPEFTEEALDRLVAAMEHGPEPWRASELGARYAQMRDMIVGFRAQVTSLSGTFKLGQDERPEVLDSILSNHPDAALVDWMRRFNGGR